MGNPEITLGKKELSASQLTVEILQSVQKFGAQIAFERINNEFLNSSALMVFRTKLLTADGYLFYGYSSGKDQDAQVASIAEAAERWLFIGDKHKARRAASQNASSHNNDFPVWLSNDVLKNLDPHLTIDAIEIRNLEARKCLIPRELFFSEKPDFATTSSGNAVHLSYERAIEAGLVELHERNLLMKNWCARKSPFPGIDLESDDVHVKSLALLPEFGFKTKWYFYYEPGLPIVAIRAIWLETIDHPCLFVGTGSGLTSHDAMVSASKECLRLWAMNYFAIANGESPSTRQVDQATLYYTRPRAQWLLDFFSSRDSFPKILTNEVKFESLQSLIKYYHPIAVALDGSTQIPAVRVFSPIACPMFFAQRVPILNWPAALPQLPLMPHPY